MVKKTIIQKPKKRGFTLVEIIISIGIVAIISSSILELFITAGNLNRKAFDMDKSVMLSETVVEQFKLLDNPEGIKNMDVLKDAYLLKSSTKNSYTIFYDNKWNVIKNNSLLNKSDEAVIKEASYIFNIFLTDVDSSGIMKMSLAVIKNKFGYMEKQTDKDFYTISVSKYFAEAGVNQ
jgi:prepilin-type N-terminal cleavage/methylation domain-containing protein